MKLIKMAKTFVEYKTEEAGVGNLGEVITLRVKEGWILDRIMWPATYAAPCAVVLFRREVTK